MKVKATLSKEQWIKYYLLIWAAMFKLTEKERDIMIELIKHHLDIEEKVNDETLRQELFMSVKARKEIREELAMSEQLMVNYLSSLTTKRALIREGDNYKINPKLIPTKQLSFEFKVVE